MADCAFQQARAWGNSSIMALVWSEFFAAMRDLKYLNMLQALNKQVLAVADPKRSHQTTTCLDTPVGTIT